MQDVIREGSLRVAATESTCDVIIGCVGCCKLMAHKIILSMGSPVLQTLLRDAAAQHPATLIFADVTATTMSLILDYIYTGYVTLRVAHVADFLALAQLLQIKLEDECLSQLDGVKSEPTKRLPELIPIRQAGRLRATRRTRGLFNKVIPSPWTPRDKEVLLDPRSDRLYASYNDSNNNIERTATMLPTVDCRSSSVDTASNLRKNKKPQVLSDVAAVHKEETETERKDEEEAEVESTKKEKPFKCSDCGKQFSQLRNYKYHRSIHDGTREFATKCPECGKMFNDKGYLSSHMKIHRDRKEYACQHCPKRFNQRVAYNMHLRIHTGVKPHECATCGKSFSRKMLLKQHQRVHTGERPYTCTECGKSFADRSNMSLHARLHTGVKPYSCTLCPKSFTKKHHLKTHMNFHTGLKPYSCVKCGLSFSQSSNMRTHYKKCILKAETDNQSYTEDPGS